MPSNHTNISLADGTIRTPSATDTMTFTIRIPKGKGWPPSIQLDNTVVPSSESKSTVLLCTHKLRWPTLFLSVSPKKLSDTASRLIKVPRFDPVQRSQGRCSRDACSEDGRSREGCSKEGGSTEDDSDGGYSKGGYPAAVSSHKS